MMRHEDGTVEATITVKLKPNKGRSSLGGDTWDVTTTFPDGSEGRTRVTTDDEEDAIVMAFSAAAEDWEEKVRDEEDEEDEEEDDEDEEDEEDDEDDG